MSISAASLNSKTKGMNMYVWSPKDSTYIREEKTYIQDKNNLSLEEKKRVKIDSFVYQKEEIRIHFYFSTRVSHIFKKESIVTLQDLLSKKKTDVLSMRGLGTKSFEEIQQVLTESFNCKIEN
jgi:DNA-directed RNA polymerase alpha subunit